MSATDPLAGEGRTALRAGSLDVSSQSTSAAVSNGSRRLSRAAFTSIARPIMAKGGTWRDVAAATGMAHGTCRSRGVAYNIHSTRHGGNIRRWSMAKAAAAAEIANSKGCRAAAAQFGVGRATMANVLRLYGYRLRRMWVQA